MNRYIIEEILDRGQIGRRRVTTASLLGFQLGRMKPQRWCDTHEAPRRESRISNGKGRPYRLQTRQCHGRSQALEKVAAGEGFGEIEMDVFHQDRQLVKCGQPLDVAE